MKFLITGTLTSERNDRRINYALRKIQGWRECPTCTELLSTYRSHFEDEDGICHQDCVNEVRELGQTPEQLLELLKTE